jgi:deoxycytidylate deaminase
MANSPGDFLSMAIGIALRSTLPKHKTGCILVNANDEVISTGWSHMRDMNLASYFSIHAEVHALERIGKLHGNVKAYIATVSGRRSRNITMGMPCLRCADYLFQRGVNTVYFTVDGLVRNFEYQRIDLNNIDINDRHFKRYRTPSEEQYAI